MNLARHRHELHGLNLRAHNLLDALMPGAHPALQAGRDLQFHHHRPYTPGDDVNDMDWKLFGRTDRYYVKRQQRASQMHACLVVDNSASMAFAGPGHTTSRQADAQPPTKFAHAQLLAAMLALILVRQGDRVGLIFSSSADQLMPPAGTWSHAHRLIDKLETTQPAVGNARLDQTLTALAGQLHRPSLVIILSDLLDEPEPLLVSLDHLRRAGGEILALQILAPAERNLSLMGAGPATLADPESRLAVRTDPAAAADDYCKLIQQHLDRIQHACLARQGDWQLAPTDTHPLDTLRHCLHRRQHRHLIHTP